MLQKTFNFINTLRKLTPAILIVFAGVSIQACDCGKQEDDTTIPPCSMPTPFKKLYDANVQAHASYTDRPVYMDLQTHEYQFRPHSNRSICKVGYEGNAALYAANKSYTIEISDAAGTILYTGSHRFASGAVDYHTLPTPVSITAGQTYTIKRIMNDPSVTLDQLQGRVLDFNMAPGVFPTVTYGIIDILSSNFYGRGGPIPNKGIPFIDIVF